MDFYRNCGSYLLPSSVLNVKAVEPVPAPVASSTGCIINTKYEPSGLCKTFGFALISSFSIKDFLIVLYDPQSPTSCFACVLTCTNHLCLGSANH